MPRAPGFWQRDGGRLLPWLLSPLAAVTAAATGHRVARPGWRAPVPVICCGNVTVGGAGKTTLALEFMRRGWPLFADEVLTLGRRAAGVSAFRSTPHLSISSRPLSSANQPAPGARITRTAPARTAQLRILAGDDGERWATAPIATRAPRPVRALCLLERGTGKALQARPLDASSSSFERHILGSWGGDIRQRERTRLYADLASSTPLIALSAGLDEPPAALADAVAAALAQRSLLRKSAA